MFTPQKIQLSQTQNLSSRLFLTGISDYNNFYRRLIVLKSLINAVFNFKRCQVSDIKVTFIDSRLCVFFQYIAFSPEKNAFFLPSRRNVRRRRPIHESSLTFNAFELAERKKFFKNRRRKILKKAKLNVSYKHNFAKNLNFKVPACVGSFKKPTVDYLAYNPLIRLYFSSVLAIKKQQKSHLLFFRLNRLKPINNLKIFSPLFMNSLRKSYLYCYSDIFSWSFTSSKKSTSFNSFNVFKQKLRKKSIRGRRRLLKKYYKSLCKLFFRPEMHLQAPYKGFLSNSNFMNFKYCSKKVFFIKSFINALSTYQKTSTDFLSFNNSRALLKAANLEQLSLKYSLESFLVSQLQVPVSISAVNSVTDIELQRYDLIKAVSDLKRELLQKGIKYSFLHTSVVATCVAAYLHLPKFLLDRIKLDLRRLKYSSKRADYFNRYLKEIIVYFTASSPRLSTMQFRVTGKVGRSVRSVKVYNPDPFLVPLIPYRSFNANIKSHSLDIKTNRGIINIALVLYYSTKFNNSVDEGLL